MVRPLLGLLLLAVVARAADDPLPSWNDTAPKRAVLDYV